MKKYHEGLEALGGVVYEKFQRSGKRVHLNFINNFCFSRLETCSIVEEAMK